MGMEGILDAPGRWFYWLEKEEELKLTAKIPENKPSQKENVIWAMKKNLVVEGILGIILPSYIGIIINHYKDPY